MSGLADTIERVERRFADPYPITGVVVGGDDLRTLLAAARRVQAMEAAGSEAIDAARQAIGAADSWGTSIGTIVAADLRALLDLASDQSAARARVRELETELSRAVRSLHEHGHKQEASAFYRFLPEVAP